MDLEDLRRIPEWMQWLLGFVTVSACIVGIVVSIMLAHHFLGDHQPENCNPTGVRQIFPETDKNILTIVCNNGYSYQP